MELRILQGNNFVDSSEKANEDDYINEVLDKYAHQKNGEKVLNKEDAKEACLEVYEKKKENDPFKASEQMAEMFPKLWKEHDVMQKDFIDLSEAYTLIQDVSKEWSREQLSPAQRLNWEEVSKHSGR